MAGKTISKKNVFKDDIVLGALFAELLGTFALTAAVLVTSGNAILVAVTVLIMVLVFGAISGAHINPAVTISLLLIKQISIIKAVGYIVAQFLGAMLALVVVTQFVASNDGLVGYKVFTVAETTGTWLPVMAEFFGALIFGFGVGSAVINKKEGFDQAFTIGGSLLLGLIVSTLGVAGVLNPAVAIGASALTANLWTSGIYIIAPIVGVTLGVLVYKFLKHDVNRSSKVNKN